MQRLKIFEFSIDKEVFPFRFPIFVDLCFSIDSLLNGQKPFGCRKPFILCARLRILSPQIGELKKNNNNEES